MIPCVSGQIRDAVSVVFIPNGQPEVARVCQGVIDAIKTIEGDCSKKRSGHLNRCSWSVIFPMTWRFEENISIAIIHIKYSMILF